jgi:pseudouridine synthase
LIGPAPAATWIVLHKPRGVVVSDRDPQGRETARQLVAWPGRLFAVGRLDAESEGLMLLTNDGELAERLAHPRYEHEKEYRVMLNRAPQAEQIETWSRGLVLADGYRTRPALLRREPRGTAGRWLRVVLREGHKRQIRESARAVGLHVERLIRIRLGPFRLGKLKPGECAWQPGEVERISPARPAARRLPGRLDGAPHGLGHPGAIAFRSHAETMKLHEYQSSAVRPGRDPRARVAMTAAEARSIAEELGGRAVKSQVLVGGRKAGGSGWSTRPKRPKMPPPRCSASRSRVCRCASC